AGSLGVPEPRARVAVRFRGRALLRGRPGAAWARDRADSRRSRAQSTRGACSMWLDPLPKEEFTNGHWDGIVDEARADFAYFALLVRDPEVLKARTLTDNDIFYNADDGLPRAER